MPTVGLSIGYLCTIFRSSPGRRPLCLMPSPPLLCCRVRPPTLLLQVTISQFSFESVVQESTDVDLFAHVSPPNLFYTHSGYHVKLPDQRTIPGGGLGRPGLQGREMPQVGWAPAGWEECDQYMLMSIHL